MPIDATRLRELCEEWQALKVYGDATSRDKKVSLLMSFALALPGLLEENERLLSINNELLAALGRIASVGTYSEGSDELPVSAGYLREIALEALNGSR